jgi:polysaccharide chain length determinant protein (PEP-CTERM system associated)
MEPGEYLDILRRRKWLIVFSFLIILFAAMAYCVVIPDQYQSGTKILIIPPAVAEGMVRSTVNLSTRDRLRAIEQDILSRPRLLGVIRKIGISRLGFDGMSEEEMSTKMRSAIDVRIERNKDRNADRTVNTFALSFLHGNPEVAQDVASNLGSLFIGENIRLREESTQETSKFLETQLEETRVRLERQEERIKQYKIQYSGELPQQEQSAMNRLQRLQDQIKNNSDAIARLQDRKDYLESQASALERNIQRGGDLNLLDAAGSGEQSKAGRLLSELALRRKKLEEVSRKYTPLHPAVVQARWELEQVEAKIATIREEARKGKGDSSGEVAEPESVPGQQQVAQAKREMHRLHGQIAQADLDITARNRQNETATKNIDEIQRKVERLPQREQEIIALSRDYDNLKKSYDELLGKKFKANISMNLEENQKAERFEVLEPAVLPSKPSKPDRLKVLGLALLASLVIGVGGSIGLEMLDPTLRGLREFKSFFEMPILACLPVIQDDRLNRRLAVRRAAVAGGLVSILGAYVVFLMLNGAKVLSIIQTIGSTIGGKN